MQLLYVPSEQFHSPAVMLITLFLLRRKALTRYQMLFRHMFYCKHVERLLCNVWISNKDFKQYSLRSPKWWACVKFTSLNLRKRRHAFSHNSNCCCAGLLLRLPSDSACWTSCKTSSTTWCLRWWSPTGTLWRTTWRRWVSDTGDARVSSQMPSFLNWRWFLRRRQTLMTFSATTPASWTTAWRTACWPTRSFSESSPNWWLFASCSQTACRCKCFEKKI